MKSKYTIIIKADTLDSLKNAMELANKEIKTFSSGYGAGTKGYRLKINSKRFPGKD